MFVLFHSFFASASCAHACSSLFKAPIFINVPSTCTPPLPPSLPLPSSSPVIPASSRADSASTLWLFPPTVPTILVRQGKDFCVGQRRVRRGDRGGGDKTGGTAEVGKGYVSSAGSKRVQYCRHYHRRMETRRLEGGRRLLGVF